MLNWQGDHLIINEENLIYNLTRLYSFIAGPKSSTISANGCTEQNQYLQFKVEMAGWLWSNLFEIIWARWIGVGIIWKLRVSLFKYKIEHLKNE